MVGIPGSGKTRLAMTLAGTKNAVHLSSDRIREEMFGDATCQETHFKVFEAMLKMTKYQLSIGRNVIYDATNLSSKRRKAFLGQLSKDTEKVCIYMATPYEVCKNRDASRTRTVGADVIWEKYKNLEIPMYHEGWDYISIDNHRAMIDSQRAHEDLILPFTFEQYAEGLKNSSLLQTCVDFDQRNSYHTLTVDRHMYEAYDYLIENDAPVSMLTAALLHDCGKPIVAKPKPDTEFLSFIGHENVSAQLAILCLKYLKMSDLYAIKVATYIQLHMRMHKLETEKAKNKLLKTVGPKLYEELLLFHEADSHAK
jgi:predicted kinase